MLGLRGCNQIKPMKKPFIIEKDIKARPARSPEIHTLCHKLRARRQDKRALFAVNPILNALRNLGRARKLRC